MALKSSPGLRLLGFFGVALILGFLLRELWSNWAALRAYSWRLKPGFALFSFAALTGSLFLLPWGLREVLALLGHRLPYSRVSKILFSSLLAKYLPGGWWALLGRAHFYRQEGLPLTQASLAVLLETVLVVTSGILTFSLFFPGESAFFRDWQKGFFILVGAGCLVFIHPYFLNLFLSLIQKVFKKSWVPSSFSYRSMAYPFAVFFCFWVGMGVSFWLLAASLTEVELSLLPQMISAFTLSWAVGFFSFITPGGLGVREGALTLLLKPFFPLYAAAALALLSRIWWLGGEVLAWVISVLWERLRRGEDRAFLKSEGTHLGLPSMPKEKRDY
jgi:uncharacterized membrane protein YbhN (UPF0104 family)